MKQWVNYDVKLKIIYGATSAVNRIHRLGIIHRDIKPDHILLDENLLPKLCDFDIACPDEVTVTNCSYAGTMAFMPKIMDQWEQSDDIYCLGLTILCILNDVIDVKKSDINRPTAEYICELRKDISESKDTLWDKYKFPRSPELRSVLMCALNEDKHIRPKAIDILDCIRKEREFSFENTLPSPFIIEKDSNDFAEYTKFVDEQTNKLRQESNHLIEKINSVINSTIDQTLINNKK